MGRMWDVGEGNRKGRGKAENPPGSAPVLWGIWHVKKLDPRENLSIVTFLSPRHVKWLFLHLHIGKGTSRADLVGTRRSAAGADARSPRGYGCERHAQCGQPQWTEKAVVAPGPNTVLIPHSCQQQSCGLLSQALQLPCKRQDLMDSQG